MTTRKLIQAGEGVDAADQAEEFQAVGMQCRECLLALIRELTEGGQFDEAGELPKKSDFKAWADTMEPLVGDRKGQHSIRINDQYRVCFRWETDGAYEVEIVDYHR